MYCGITFCRFNAIVENALYKSYVVDGGVVGTHCLNAADCHGRLMVDVNGTVSNILPTTPPRVPSALDPTPTLTRETTPSRSRTKKHAPPIPDKVNAITIHARSLSSATHRPQCSVHLNPSTSPPTLLILNRVDIRKPSPEAVWLTCFAAQSGHHGTRAVHVLRRCARHCGRAPPACHELAILVVWARDGEVDARGRQDRAAKRVAQVAPQRSFQLEHRASCWGRGAQNNS